MTSHSAMVKAVVNVGMVVEFDEHVGLGTVETQAGQLQAGQLQAGRRYAFHCTAIADGSRTVAPGTQVHFTIVPAHKGTYEATNVHPF